MSEDLYMNADHAVLCFIYKVNMKKYMRSCTIQPIGVSL